MRDATHEGNPSDGRRNLVSRGRWPAVSIKLGGVNAHLLAGKAAASSVPPMP